MRTLIVSDLHSNAEALKAVLHRVRRKRFEQIVCLGDFVGYGAQPNQILDVMRTFKARKIYIRGNHDRVAAGMDDGRGFNYAAKYAALWTRDHLSGPNRNFLRKLPLGPLNQHGMMLCHGSPDDEDEYVFTEHHARKVLMGCTAPIVFYGHTHLPVIFAMDRHGEIGGYAVEGDITIKLNPEYRYLINPGSVGQPRDRNPASSFAMYDSERKRVQFFRTEYDFRKTQESIIKAGLPQILADRLAIGS
ncbi:MAG TPA: metallophosphoesterase family protein [Thermoanaerobaculia bacterium]|nr:metallophosphoesterase family protein [Thermoanaerobaculia bacterium]